MRKTISYMLLLAMLFSSCSDVNPDIQLQGQQMAVVQGTVTDLNNNLLEHIKITVSTGVGVNTQTHYTSSEGKFHCEIPFEMISGQVSLNILIEDIDGEKNGGCFETRSDTVTIYEDDEMNYPIIIDLPTFRLNPSTASESTRQF